MPVTRKVDSTLAKLTRHEISNLRGLILNAIYEQPPHHSPAYNAPMAYELSVLNWDLATDLSGMPHLYDEWWLTRNTDIA